MSNLKVNAEEFENLINGDKPVLVDFYADWCGPCKMMSPIIEQLAEEADGKYEVCKVNIDENMDLASRYKIVSIPMFVVIKNGEVVSKAIGAMPKDEVAALLG
jgi:thioredoxin 1